MTSDRGRLDARFRILWYGQALSSVGDYAFRIALIVFVLQATDSSTALAAAVAALMVPTIALFLVGGAVGDRFDRRGVLVAADTARLVAVGGITAAVVARPHDVVLPIVLAVGMSAADAFFQPAFFSTIPDIVSADDLAVANSRIGLTRQIGLIAGPAVGGGLLAAGGPAAAFGLDAASFAVSVASLVALRGMTRRVASATAVDAGARSRLRDDIRVGLRYVVRTTWLAQTIAVTGVANGVLAGLLDVCVPVLLLSVFHAGGWSVGVFFTLEGAGALLGAALLRRRRIDRPGATLYLALAVMGGCLVLLAASRGAWGLVPAGLCYGVCMHVFNATWDTLVQRRIPAAVLGRVSSVDLLGSYAVIPVGTFAMGPLVSAFGATATVVVGGAAVCALALGTRWTGAIRGLDTTPAPDADIGRAIVDASPAGESTERAGAVAG